MIGEKLKTDRVLAADTGDYRVLKPLGLPGATARVYLIRREQDQRQFALKLMEPGLSPEMQKNFRDELVNLQRLRAAEDRLGTNHIPQIIESSNLQEPATQELFNSLGTPFIIMEYAEGTDLDALLAEKNVLNEAEALEIARQFAEVLVALHGENFNYTDMKSGNLIWNAPKNHLMVIDWNVIAENTSDDDTVRDRLRAAAYLYQMATGIPIPLNDSAEAVTNQRFRRLDNFKRLSVGTQRFLIKAFHPDVSARHGNRASSLECSRQFMQQLKEQAKRFSFSAHQLVTQGQKALQDRQWEEAYLYLDIAERKSDIEASPDHFAQLQKDLETIRERVTQLGRNTFFSGKGRYDNGLYAEALVDLERAVLDDPYDEEARLYAILTTFAKQIGETDYSPARLPGRMCPFPFEGASPNGRRCPQANPPSTP